MPGSAAPLTRETPATTAPEAHRTAIILVPGRLERPTLARRVKRAIDIVGASAGLLFAAPLCAAIALAIRLESPGSVIYTSTRVGKRGKRFCFYKFRTMVDHAEDRLAELQARNERSGILFKIAADPRLTRVGRVLRKYSLDELPQLANVLLGDMSLVGPRPALPSEVEQYPADCRRRLAVTPGITGLWQVRSRGDPSWERYVELDLRYVNEWSLWLDFKILLWTVPAVLRGTGV